MTLARDGELPAVFLAWIHGWAVNRQVAPPVAHADGFRIEVHLPRQARRYVFPGLSPTLAQLGGSISQPWVFLKACATSDALRGLLPAHWQIQDEGALMTCGAQPFAGTGPLPAGYSLVVTDHGKSSGLVSVQVNAADGSPAAAGHLALGDRMATYDRIVTEPAHRRLGLGRAVMAALQSRAHAHGCHAGVLVASREGQRLYASLGWRLRSPWATAVIPGPDEAA
jgi:GNAT superfamily N-acetyltransferase